jgi:ABC-type nickel/cobalt efflux system permease component RcnA
MGAGPAGIAGGSNMKTMWIIDAVGACACWVGALGWQILAQSNAMPESIPPWANMTATGLLGVLAVYLTVRTIPQMQQSHREERKEDRAEFLKQLEAARADHKEVVQQMIRSGGRGDQ